MNKDRIVSSLETALEHLAKGTALGRRRAAAWIENALLQTGAYSCLKCKECVGGVTKSLGECMACNGVGLLVVKKEQAT